MGTGVMPCTRSFMIEQSPSQSDTNWDGVRPQRAMGREELTRAAEDDAGVDIDRIGGILNRDLGVETEEDIQAACKSTLT